MTKKYFKEQTIKELKALKKNATKAEIGRLYFTNLNPWGTKSCIYGQMTGHCRSGRAKKLISLCCNELMNTIGGIVKSNRVDGSTKDGPASLYSFLESHIMNHEEDNHKIFGWLKGETKTFPTK